MRLNKYIILIAFIFYGCNRCSQSEIRNYSIPSDFNTYFGMFKPGNWWVYISADSTLSDSAYVTNYQEYTYGPTQKDYCRITQTIQFNIAANYLTGGGVYSSNITWFGENSYLATFTDTTLKYYIYGSTAPPIFAGLALSSSSVFGNYPGPQASDTSYQLLPHLSIAGNNYDSVIYCNSGVGRVVYFAPNIGIIRFSLGDTVFNLKIYYIN